MTQPQPAYTQPLKSAGPSASDGGDRGGTMAYPAYGATTSNAASNNNRTMIDEGTETFQSLKTPEVSNASRKTAAAGIRKSGGRRRIGSSSTGSMRRSKRNKRMYNIKTQSSTFLEDARGFKPGSLPHSMVLALAIGVVCGVCAWIYYTLLFWLLDYVWKTLPYQIFGVHHNTLDNITTISVATTTTAEGLPVVASEVMTGTVDVERRYYVLWIPIVAFTMALGVGITVTYIGDPGDLPYTIKCVHDEAYVSMDHVLPMVCASQFSILAGGSLGPEAPLVAICAALGGFVSRAIFRTTSRNLVRKHTLMGMAGALAAFFGVPLGGSLFALEVCSRFGIEYFEHLVEAILCGEICIAVFRGLARLPIEPIWHITSQEEKMIGTSSLEIVYGMILGLIGAFVAFGFNLFHKFILTCFRRFQLLDDNQYAISRALLGTCAIVLIGICIPQTMFWGEYEFQTLSTLSPASTLEHVWPTYGLLHFEMNSFTTCLVVGVMKLGAISFTVAAGYRGGYIFPVFAASAAFGRAIYFLCPFIPVELCVLCMAAALNVALTRTALATTLILCYLAGDQDCMSAVMAASLVSLFVTGYMYFIPTQTARQDIDEAIFSNYPALNRAESSELDRVAYNTIETDHTLSATLNRQLSRSIRHTLSRTFSNDSDIPGDGNMDMLLVGTGSAATGVPSSAMNHDTTVVPPPIPAIMPPMINDDLDSDEFDDDDDDDVEEEEEEADDDDERRVMHMIAQAKEEALLDRTSSI